MSFQKASSKQRRGRSPKKGGGKEGRKLIKVHRIFWGNVSSFLVFLGKLVFFSVHHVK